LREEDNLKTYFKDAFAPASSIFFTNASPSALLQPSFTGFGAASTRSLASFKPSPVISRTTLIAPILFDPALSRTTSNSVFSAAASPAAAGAATATAAYADTPHLSSNNFESSDASNTDNVDSSSTIFSSFADIKSLLSFYYLSYRIN